MMLNLYKVVIFSIFRIRLRERFDILLSPKKRLNFKFIYSTKAKLNVKIVILPKTSYYSTYKTAATSTIRSRHMAVQCLMI